MPSSLLPARRRLVIAAALACASPFARAQAARIRVAYLMTGELAMAATLGPRLERGFNAAGLRTEVRMFHAADDGVEALARAARDAVAWGPQLIVAPGPLMAQAAVQATREIPVVFFGVADPERFGLVKSVARPGGNVTGIASNAGAITVKRMELVRDLLPHAKRVTALVRRRTGANLAPLETARRLVGEVAKQNGLRVEDADVEGRGLRATLDLLARDPADALVGFGPYAWEPGGIDITDATKLLVDFERRTRCLVVHDGSFAMDHGAVVAMYDTGRQVQVAIDMAARVLRGASPATLPVETGTTYALAVNPAAARAIGHTLPAAVMIRAEVVKG